MLIRIVTFGRNFWNPKYVVNVVVKVDLGSSPEVALIVADRVARRGKGFGIFVILFRVGLFLFIR